MYTKHHLRRGLLLTVTATTMWLGATGPAGAEDPPPTPGATDATAPPAPDPTDDGSPPTSADAATDSTTTTTVAPASTEPAAPPTTVIAPTSTTTPPAAIATTTAPPTTTPPAAIAEPVAAVAPTAPLSPVATPANGGVTLTWKAPSSNGGASIQYDVQQIVNGQWKTIGSPAMPSYPVFGLTNGVKYSFRIRAHNSAGYGPFSTTVSAVPRTVPSAPLSPTATPGNGTVSLTWKPPSNNGGATVTKYAVQQIINGQWTNVAFPTTGAYTKTGLTNGVTYYFRIRAYNEAGWSPVSTTVSAVPRTVPSAPLSVVATPGNHAVSLSWKAPSSNGGAAVISYTVEYFVNGQWQFVASTANHYYTLSSPYLVNGTKYSFRIRAHNPAGGGAYSTVVSAVPRTVPSAVPYCNADQSSPGSQWMVVDWTTPQSNGGTPITGYEISLWRNGFFHKVVTVPAGPNNVTAIAVGTTGEYYEVRVTAHNAAGYGATCVTSVWMSL